jgi:hypothetical protein
MAKPPTDQSAHHTEEKEKPGAGGNRTPQPAPKDANSSASKPQGTLQDQVATMESEGQAQPQEGDRTPEELERATESRAEAAPRRGGWKTFNPARALFVSWPAM